MPIDGERPPSDDDGFDALEEEISEIQSASIRLMSRYWPRLESEDSRESPREYFTGETLIEAIVDNASNPRAESWMAQAEQSLRGASHSSSSTSRRGATLSARDVALSETRSAERDAKHSVDESTKTLEAVRLKTILITIALLIATSAVARTMSNFFSQRSMSPLRVVETLAYRGLANLPAPFINPSTVIDLQRKQIEILSEEKVVLLERLRLTRRVVEEQRTVAAAWQAMFIKCRTNNRDLFDRAPSSATSTLSWSPAWAFYTIPRADTIETTLRTTRTLLRRYACPLLVRFWPQLETPRAKRASARAQNATR